MVDKIFLFEKSKQIETGKLSFEAFYAIAANFLEDEDDEAMQNELKEAFRLYDKEGWHRSSLYLTFTGNC